MRREGVRARCTKHLAQKMRCDTHAATSHALQTLAGLVYKSSHRPSLARHRRFFAGRREGVARFGATSEYSWQYFYMNLVGMITRTHVLPFGTRPSWVNTNVGTCGCGGRAMESRKHRCTCSTARQGGTSMTMQQRHSGPTFHCQRIEGASALPDIPCTSSFPQTKRKFADGGSRGPPPIPMRPCLLFSQKKRKRS